MGTGVRKTYVLSLRGEGGPATVEEVHSGRVARLESVTEAPAQIERWMRDHATVPQAPPEKADSR